MIQPKPEIVNARRAAHGGYVVSQWGQHALLDFSANINPFGPSPRVREALLHVPFERHPDPESVELRASLAQQLSLDASQIMVGNGSLELIRNLAIAYVRPSDLCLVVGPTFGEYRVACELMGGQVVDLCAKAEAMFVPDVKAIVAAIQRWQPRLVFVCNPNNPTGVYLSRESIESILQACAHSLLVLDEAFVQFVEPRWDACQCLASGQLVIMRSMTKDYALAGLRLGYVLAHESIINALSKVQAPWSVNAFAQAAGLAALADAPHLAATLRALRAAKQELLAALAAPGLMAMPSAVHYFPLEVGEASTFRANLLRQGISVRDCTSFGLPRFVRLATQRPEHNAQLLAALRELRP